MNLQNLLPHTPQVVLKDLGGCKADWLSYDKAAGNLIPLYPKMTPAVMAWTRLVLHGGRVLSGKNEYTHAQPSGASALGLLWFYSLSRLTTDGVRVFYPTDEMCESMEHVDLRLPVTDYRQPYPCMLVRLPPAYRRSLAVRTGFREEDMPLCTVALHRADWGLLYTACQFSDRVGGGTAAEMSYLFAEGKEPLMENSLRKFSNDAAPHERALSVAVSRVTLNLCLMLAGHPTRLAPSNPGLLDDLKAKIRRGVKVETNQQEVNTHAHFILTDQDIVVRRVSKTPATGEGHHPSPKPHWRRGHYRNARVGEGGQQRRLVFIRPVLVNAGLADSGSPVPTVSYH